MSWAAMIRTQLPGPLHPLAREDHRLLAEPAIHRVERRHEIGRPLERIEQLPGPVLERQQVIQEDPRLREEVTGASGFGHAARAQRRAAATR